MFARSSLLIKALNCMAGTANAHVTGRYPHGRIRIAFQKRLQLPAVVFLTFRQKTMSTRDPSVWRIMWKNMFSKYLLVTNTVSSGILMVIGDAIAQKIRLLCESNETEWSYRRLWHMFIVGAAMGPMHHFVYIWMDKVMPAQSLLNIGRKILIDQLFMSPACIFIFFYTICLLEKTAISETNQELISKFPYIYAMDWAVWPAVQFINFRYLDTKYRVIYVNLITALYDVFLSYMKHSFHLKWEI